MIIEVATAAWFCFQHVPVCYDQSTVKTIGPEVATVATNGQLLFGLIVNCENKTHRVIAGTQVMESPWEDGSVAARLCEKYQPQG